ncbi:MULTISPECIES: YbaB/EbfC family nucleoid-associated protein [unclassified Nocardioides]|uniref:YbaB/EbfC family nucleoid-associated protein n=1 Tax=unclassified Nocardioides TaxID=2615069 RepID=UPI002665F2F2|nr:YbaB/EbfC family nucleoid-associated protein [Nocardioides sp. Arc9.136]WKN49839.1 YbaB/EbfC family nucleoid-associated protein [Nocardioides sp. Arc9.136]
MYSSPEEALASVDRAAAKMQEQVVKAQAYAVEVETLRIVGQSRDGGAEVTVGHNGAIHDLYLGRTLNDATLERIRSAVLEANADAQRQVVERVSALSAETFGADSATAREITRQYADMFPAPPDDGGSPTRAGVLG